ncbi:hypothetical protein [Adhaeribacter pallidiroseus]|uniref:Uncharacterized protein n=1 Tax=Adhaeribacter pallidiroseus TaxID=2072847 RepID=A0A369Q5R1_9BACT|nr:hypothetical protein [Adhaeribacter pallidiroseus]RDC58845.1 hypothetical protein AHMF7616_05279 [Adhaeribacter pallidiroseus]
MPASIATLVGLEHRYNFFNDSYQALSGNRTNLGRTVAEVFPEVVEQGFIALLDQVYATVFLFEERKRRPSFMTKQRVNPSYFTSILSTNP